MALAESLDRIQLLCLKGRHTDCALSHNQVTITAAQGGHSGPVQVLLPFGQFLLSGDWLGTIKLWDMASGQCVQTMQQAHREPVMGVLQWEVRSSPTSHAI